MTRKLPTATALYWLPKINSVHHRLRLLRSAMVLALGGGASSAQEAPDWSEVGALFAERCVICHSGEGAPLGLHLDSYEGALTGSEDGPVLVPGDLEGSELARRVRGETEPRMPLVGDPLAPEEIALIERWIEVGLPEREVASAAPTPDEAQAEAAEAEDETAAAEPLADQAPPEESAQAVLPGPDDPVTFAHVEPIFLQRCVVCHSDANADGPPEGLRLDSYENILAGGEEVVVLPGSAEASEIMEYIDGSEEPRMPLNGPPLPDDQIRLIRQWIEQGAADAEGTPAPLPVRQEAWDDDGNEEARGHDDDDDDDEEHRDRNDDDDSGQDEDDDD